MSPKGLFGLVVFGSYRIGKTSLITKFIDGDFDRDEYNPSIGLQLYTKHGFPFQLSDNKEGNSESETSPRSAPNVDIQIFEATERGCVNSRRDFVYTRMSVVILAYAITDAPSFRTARSILNRAREYESDNLSKSGPKIFLVGLMADREEDRVVSLAQGEELASEFGVNFRELSALKDGEGVMSLFGDVAPFLVARDEKVKEVPREKANRWTRIWEMIIPWT
ncbi:small GTPase superfamily [Aspergillus pseudoustus]|uniref:Small GTPase superfamily n=1 Tax=Aspergillus pseudoustus TaxID=1810923 RepID=A0ABR4IHP5_9EURO